MAYEAEIITDRTKRRGSTVSRQGWQVAAILRSDAGDRYYRTEVATEFKGRLVTMVVRRFDGDSTTPKQQVLLLDNADVNELLNGKTAIRRTASGAAAPPLLPGEPDLLD